MQFGTLCLSVNSVVKKSNANFPPNGRSRIKVVRQRRFLIAFEFSTMKSILFALLAASSLHAATQITWKRQQLHGDFYSEGAAIGDINGDGKPDVVAGPFWWEGPDFKEQHVIYEPKIFDINGYSDNFFAYVHDFNADDRNDLLVLGFPGKEARLYLNPGFQYSNTWPMHIVADVVDNESPVFTDITGDGKPEIVCSTGGKFGWFAPNWGKPTEKWPFVAATDDMKVAKFTHGLGVGDVNGDGKMDLLEARRWWENSGIIASTTNGPSLASFTQHNFAAGVGGGAQMFAYDFDGNGTQDVFTSLAAHRYGVAVFLQTKNKEPGTANWTRVMLASEQPQDNDYGIVFSQPHAAFLTDIDGDGVKDIVTGKRYWAHNGHDPDERGHRVIYWYQTKRDGNGGVDFVPHLVDAESGVGVDVQVGDVNGDSLPDIVVGNKAGVFILTQERKETTADLTPKKLYGPALKPQAEYAKGTVAAEMRMDIKVLSAGEFEIRGHRLTKADMMQRIRSAALQIPDLVVNITPSSELSEETINRLKDDLTNDAGVRWVSSKPRALDLMQLPGGFKAELIAAEPDLVQPIAFTFDERGRIWVVEGNSYPKPREVGAGQDRIKILEDKDGDGTFETKKIFCEGLNLVSGIELGFGGVWVGAAPYLMFIPDKDRNDQPDPSDPNDPRPKVPGLNFTAYALLDGWGSQDTHETLNSFIWGPDGWLYGCHGVFTHSLVGKPGTPDDQRQPINAGIWRYHPVRHEFEIFAHGTSNPWGLDYDQYGEFFVTACVIPHLYHIVPGGRYQRQAGQHFNAYTYEDIKTIADHAHYAGSLRPNIAFDKTTGAGFANEDTNALGGGHAHCGLAIYQSSLFPPTYRNQLIFGNLHGHRLVANYTDVHGSTYIGKHGADFLRANDMHFIPVTQKVGPDGALYVSDWSDQQICHRGSNAVENWDRTNGRIYRISYGSAGTLARSSSNGGEAAKTNEADKSARAPLFPAAPFDLNTMPEHTLAALAMQTENEWFSRTARRVLMEHHESNAAEIQAPHKMVKSASIAEHLRAMWLFHAVTDDSRVLGGPNSPDDIKVWHIRLVIDKAFSDALPNTEGLARFLTKLHAATGTGPIVHRELASALQRLPIDQRKDLATALLKHGEDKDDPMIPLLIWYGIEPVVAADPAVGMQLAKASKMPKVTGFIYRRLSTDDAGRIMLLRLAAESEDTMERESLLKSVVEAARAGNKISKPEDWDKLRDRLMATQMTESPRSSDMGPPLKGILVAELEVFMGVEPAIAAFRERLTSTMPLGMPAAAQLEARLAALKLLAQIRDKQTASILHALLEDGQKTPTVMRRAAIQALGSLNDAETPKVLSSLLPKLSTNELPDAVNTLASTKEGAKALLMAVEAKTVPATALSPFLVRQLTSFDDEEIHALIKSAWGDVNAPKADLAVRMQKYREMLTPGALKLGDVAKGKTLFTATCGQCHKLFGEGQNVGPDITGSNRADLNYLLENVLDPNAVIGKAYQLNLFTMKDGRVMSGVIKDESPAAVKIAMMGGVEFTLPVADIAKREVSKLSTMPEGLFDALQPGQVIDLVKYLQSGAAPVAKNSAKAEATLVPGALEGEALKVLSKTGGNTRPQGMGGFGNAWSGGSQLWWTGAKQGDKLTLAIPVKEKGNYALIAALAKAKDYGIIEVSLDGKPVATGWDGYNPNVIHSGVLDWGTHTLDAGEHQLVITISGTNANALPKFMVGVDYVKLERKP